MGARVLLVMEHGILLDGLERLLLQEDRICSVVTAEALETAHKGCADVMVLDADTTGLPGRSSIERVRGNASPPRWIALTAKSTRHEVERIMRSGAAGIVSRNDPARCLAEAVCCVHGGRGYVSTDVAKCLISASLDPKLGRPKDVLSSLSRRESEVLRLIAEDCSSREIAERLGISTRTVETHRARLMGKLELRKTAALVRFAVREGLVSA